MKKALIILSAAVLLITAGCGTTVKRVDSSTQIDLSGYWNDTDVRIVCDALVKDCLTSARVDQAIRNKRSMPKVIVGRFRNESSEQIDTSIISSIMEAAIFNSGRLDFVAPASLREELRAEIASQQEYASPQTMSRLRNETGADFMMTGSVRTIVDREGNRTVRTYYVTAEMTDIETTERIWLGNNTDIKKIITRPNNRL